MDFWSVDLNEVMGGEKLHCILAILRKKLVHDRAYRIVWIPNLVYEMRKPTLRENVIIPCFEIESSDTIPFS